MRTLPPHHPFRSPKARERYLAHYDSWAQSWSVPSEVRMVPTEYGDTLVRISGPTNAAPLVLLPAAKLHSLLWMDDVPLFSRRFRTYAVDAIYDNGRSVSSKPVLTIESATAWLDGLLDGLGLDGGVRLMGASLGAWLTAEYCLHAPHRLAAAVWAAPPAVVMPPSKEWIARAMLTLVPTRFGLGGLMDFTCPVASGSTGRTKEIYDIAVDNIVLGGKCFRTRPFPGGPRVLSDDDLRRIDVPVLYIEGEHEVICSPDQAVARLNAIAPHIETAVIAGADHTLSWTQFDAVNGRILEFLDGNAQVT